MSKPRSQLYGGRIPGDYLSAHNHVLHTAKFFHGLNGFRRFWLPPEYAQDGQWAVCPCGWRSHERRWTEPHYAHAEHVEWWENAIKEHGSLEAVYDNIADGLRTQGLDLFFNVV
jgi:hypothetical protein